MRKTFACFALVMQLQAFSSALFKCDKVDQYLLEIVADEQAFQNTMTHAHLIAERVWGWVGMEQQCCTEKRTSLRKAISI